MERKVTKQSLFNLWFWNFQNPTLQQYSNLYHSTIAIIKAFNDKGDYNETLAKMDNLFFHPILFLKEKYNEFKVTKNPVDWDISKLEWCYYRDTRFKSKLSTEYFTDSRKIQETKRLTLGEIITLLSLVKTELFEIIVKILIKEDIDLMITLPSGVREIEQVGSGDIV